MSDDEFKERVIQLLEIIAFGGNQGCAHESAIDQSTFGMKPQQRMFCPECSVTFDGSDKE